MSNHDTSSNSSMQQKNVEDSLRWRFDVNTFRLLGRELITDRVTAVFELVKNCYDANATEVIVDFFDIIKKDETSKIIIRDNGVGMSFKDIKDKWMVVGTNSKRTKLYSDPPFNRKFVGEKGIGRFAVDKLGERVIIRTKQRGEDRWLNVNINWDEYEIEAKSAQKSNQLSLFTDIDNVYYYEPGLIDEQGTSLIITKINDVWTGEDLERMLKELSKLISPFYPLNPPFNIWMNSNEYVNYTDRQVRPDPIKYFSHQAEIGFDHKDNSQQILKFNSNTGKLYTENIPIKDFGPVRLKLYYFNEAAKRRYNAAYKNDDSRIDGIKIYRDNVIATPFAEYESNTEKRRDILGIDKRRWGSTFDKIGTREIIGILDITKIDNPNIIDATNRQDFIENTEYRALKEFIHEQIKALEELKLYERESKKTEAERELQKAGLEAKKFSTVLNELEKEIANTSRPELVEMLKPIKEKADELKSSISLSISEQKKFQREVERKEKILYSIVSMQEYAALMSHAVRTSITKVKHMGEFFMTNFPNPSLDSIFKIYANSIYNEMNTMIAVTDFMLSFANTEKGYEEFNIKDLLNDLLKNAYLNVFIKEGIDLEIEISDDFVISANKQAFQDVFQNLVSNSIKALKNNNKKIIKCSGFLDIDRFIIYFSDNGIGIDVTDREWIFGLYNTRTAEQGGAGLGLYIVEKQITAMGGTIEVIENELKPTGATFKITLPFNKA